MEKRPNKNSIDTLLKENSNFTNYVTLRKISTQLNFNYITKIKMEITRILIIPSY